MTDDEIKRLDRLERKIDELFKIAAQLPERFEGHLNLCNERHTVIGQMFDSVYRQLAAMDSRVDKDERFRYQLTGSWGLVAGAILLGSFAMSLIGLFVG